MNIITKLIIGDKKLKFGRYRMLSSLSSLPLKLLQGITRTGMSIITVVGVGLLIMRISLKVQ